MNNTIHFASASGEHFKAVIKDPADLDAIFDQINGSDLKIIKEADYVPEKRTMKLDLTAPDDDERVIGYMITKNIYQ